ncbi:MAG: rhodanese-like domain-containing protein [Verrucomicrobiota bacterium]|nr:rhodanese-like domain-containing protein [Verrucomicrobiota bacterium]
MVHSPGFLKIVNEAKPHVKEIAPEQLKQRLEANPNAVLIDIREDHEWTQGHAEGAVHLGKGILERDLEKQVPNPETELILYCGGGYRSILSAEAAQRMGYRNVFSLQGGYKGLVEAGWKIKIP